MTLLDTTRRVVYVGDGSTKTFPFTFKVFAASQVAVFVNDGEAQTQLSYGSQFSVTLEANGTGTVTLPEALPDEDTIAIVSAVPATQEMKLTNQGAFYPTVINDSADKMTALIQQIDEKVSRAIQLPETSTQTTAEAYDELASAAETANEALALMDETLDAATEVMDALRDAGDVTGATQVVATGATEARSIASKLADTMSIDDFGAVADGVTDDSSALIHADASGCTALDLRGKTVATNYLPENITLKNGYLNYRGQVFNVEGAKPATGGLLAHRHLADLAVYTTNGTTSFDHSSRAAQGIAYLNDGSDRVFMAVRHYGSSNGNDHQMGAIAEYVLGEAGATVDFSSVALFLPIGHAQGLGVRKDSLGETYIYATAASLPDRYLSNGANYGKGFCRIHWRGNDTTAADCVNFRLLPYQTSEGRADLMPYGGVGLMTPTITPDGKRIVLLGGGRVFIYDLEAVEACLTPDTPYTWSDAGVSDPTTDNESASMKANWAVPPTQIDATEVEPLAVFPVDVSTSRTLQGIATDGRYIFLSSGTSSIGASTDIQVYDFEGRLLRIITHQAGTAIYSKDELEGKGALGVLSANENEGIFVRGDQLVVLHQLRWSPRGDVVSYKGKRYCLVGAATSTGDIPDTTMDGVWSATTLPATAGEWDVGNTYSRPDRTSYISRETELRRLVAIEPYKAGDASQIPISCHALNYGFHKNETDRVFAAPVGARWTWSFQNPVTGESEFAVRFGRNGIWRCAKQYPLSVDGVSQMRSYGDIGVATENGSALTAPFYRAFSSLDPLIPGVAQFVTNGSVPYVLAQLSSRGFHARVNTSISALGWGLFTVDEDSVNREKMTAKAYSSSTTTWFASINKHLGFAKYSYDASTDTYTMRSSVCLFGDNFSATSDNAIALGRSSYRWSTVYAATGSINTSDERVKDNIADPDEALMRAWGKVSFRVFRFKDAIAKKGDAARIHVGLIAQQVREAFAAEGLDADRYGLFCYDRWDAKPAEIDPETGEEIEPAVEAGDRYGIRYDEALALECAYQRWRLAKLEEKLG